VLLDPPYGQGLLLPAVAALAGSGWIAPGALVVAELGRDEDKPPVPALAEWAHGAARMLAWRA
jgi:16S rRNA (guanine966-N2)-methyltransferase